jgi:hypothetical protein
MAYIHKAGKIRRSEGLLYVDPILDKKANAALAAKSNKPIKT